MRGLRNNRNRSWPGIFSFEMRIELFPKYVFQSSSFSNSDWILSQKWHEAIFESFVSKGEFLCLIWLFRDNCKNFCRIVSFWADSNFLCQFRNFSPTWSQIDVEIESFVPKLNLLCQNETFRNLSRTWFQK